MQRTGRRGQEPFSKSASRGCRAAWKKVPDPLDVALVAQQSNPETKAEIRSTKSETNPKYETPNPKQEFPGFVLRIWSFGFRISCFGFGLCRRLHGRSTTDHA